MVTVSPCSEEIRGCLEALAQCRLIVEGLGPERFAQPVGRHAAVGSHLRHCLDHFDCFFDGLSRGTLDYDARIRRAAWETDAAVALEVIADFEQRLATLAPQLIGAANAPLAVWQSVASGAEARRCAQSSVDRELAFLSSHTIHHLALMRVVIDMAGWNDAAPAEVGVAYSTRAHQAAVSK